MVVMRMRAVSVLLALVMSLLLLTLDVGPAYACSCMDVPLKNDIRDADAVFSPRCGASTKRRPAGEAA